MSDREQFDAIVIGAGPAGEVVAGELAEGGFNVAIVERERVAGECSFWACMPSKALLRPGHVLAQAQRIPGAAEAAAGELNVERALAWRDKIVSNWDDSGYVTWLTDRGIELIRGAGRIVGDGGVDVEDRRLRAAHIVIATGSVPSIPPIEGLNEAAFWTNREATGAHEIPDRLLIIGAGAVGVELSQAYASFGASVALIDAAPHILPGEDVAVADALAPVLSDQGVEIRAGTGIARIGGGENERHVTLEDGTELRGDALLVATGRKPNTADLGLESLPVKLDRGAIEVDSRLRAAPGVYAIGDASGVNLTTHTGKYQARVCAAEILGKGYDADYRAIPRIVYTDPSVAAVGLTPAAARESGIDVRVGTADFATTAASSLTRADWRDAHNQFLSIVADQSGTIVGAYAVAPGAEDWFGQLTLAVQQRVTAEELARTIQPFPAASEVITLAARELL